MATITIYVGPGANDVEPTPAPLNFYRFPEGQLHPFLQRPVFGRIFSKALREDVIVATHSLVPLDVAWALKYVTPAVAFRKLLHFKKVPKNAEVICKVIYVDTSGATRDISGLDPGSEDTIESEWGGLSTTSSEAGELVRTSVNKKELNRG